VTLTLRGHNLQNVQTVAISPAAGIAVGASVVNADGTVINSGLTVAGNAPL
jgi:hypothetical protein